ATTALDEFESGGGMEIKSYPNPFSHEVTIELNLNDAAEVTVFVFNQLGQKVKTLAERAELSAGINRLIWDGSNENQQKVNPGMYHLQIVTDGNYHYRKVVYTNR